MESQLKGEYTDAIWDALHDLCHKISLLECKTGNKRALATRGTGDPVRSYISRALNLRSSRICVMT